MKKLNSQYAREELQRRWEIGHQFGCQCGMKPSCAELRKNVDWEFINEAENPVVVKRTRVRNDARP